MIRFIFIAFLFCSSSIHAQYSASGRIGKMFGKSDQSKEKDNPQARINFDELRLQNPKTGKIPPGIHEAEVAFYRKELQSIPGNARTQQNLRNWERRGPYNVGGRTRALAIDRTNEEIILAGGVSGGMWRSTDGGDSWVKTTGSSELQSVTAVAQDLRPGNTDTWYYTTGEFSGNSASAPDAFYYGNGVFKSEDGGASWVQLDATTDGFLDEFDQCFDINHEVAVSPIDGSVFVANYCGIFTSDDGGITWTQVYESPGEGGWSDVVVSSTGSVYAYIKEGTVIVSDDNGENWTDISADNFPNFREGDRGELALAPSNENILYLLAEAPTASGHALWKYNAATDVWVNRSSNIPLFGGLTGDFDSQGGYDLLIKVKPDNENFVVIGGINLFRSTDGFETRANTVWIGGYTPLNTSFGLYANHHPDQHALVFYHTNPNQALSGNDGGVQFTEDIRSSFSEIVPVTWVPLNNGYLTSQAYAVSAGPGDQILAGFQDNGTWLTVDKDPKTFWTLPFGGDGAYNDFSSDGLTRFVSSQNGNVYRVEYSSPEDMTAENFVPFPPEDYSSELFIAPFYLDPVDDDIFYLGGADSLYVNTEAQIGDTDTGWKRIGLPNIDGVVTQFGLVGNGDVYVGTSGGQIYLVSNVGTNAVEVIDRSDFAFEGNYISGIGVNRANPNEVILCVSNYNVVSIYHSEDAGETWTNVSGNLEDNPDGTGFGPSTRVVRILGDGELYLVGTSVGLFTTTTLNGENTEWIREDMNELGAVVVEHLDVRDTDGQVLAATHGNGIFSASIPLNPVDLAVTEITSPVSGTTSGSEQITITISNMGQESHSGFELSYAVNGNVQETVSPNITIDAGDKVEFVFETAFDFSLGEYMISAAVDAPNDANPNNDTFSKVISKAALITEFPYQESFETDDHLWQATELWELGTPRQTNLDGASDGNKAWATDLNSNYPDNTTAVLQSPVFDFSDLNIPFVSMDLNFQIEDTWDGAVLAYRTDINDRNFKHVPLQTGISNWYNDISQAIGNSAWTGSSGGYVTATADLSFLAGEPEVQLALVFVSDEAVTEEGIAMDNFRIFDSGFSITDKTVDEESATGTLVGSFVGSSGYELVAGEGDDDNESFTIVGDELLTAAVLDYEEESNYSIRVSADNGQEIVFEIDLINSNDAPYNLQLSSTKIRPDVDPGDFIGEFSAEDINEDDEITYSLVDGAGGEDNTFFEIEGSALVTAEGLEVTDNSQRYNILVEAEDASGAFTVEPFVLTVEEILGLINLARHGISIFPNPVSDFLNLKITNQHLGGMAMTIYNLQGRAIMHQTWNKQTRLIKDRINFTHLEAGTYLVLFDLNGEKVHGKLVKR